MPGDNVQHVESWFVTGVAADGSSKRGPLRVWGVPRGTSRSGGSGGSAGIHKRQRLWRSSSIVRRLSSTLLETRFGTRVRLSGPLDTQAAKHSAMKPSAQRAFRNGFPYRWRAIAVAAFDSVPRRARDTLPEQPIIPPAQVNKKSTSVKKKVPRMSAPAHIVVPVENFVPEKKSPPRARADSLPPAANRPISPPPPRRATIDAEIVPPPPTAAKPPRPKNARRARRASQPAMPTANGALNIKSGIVVRETASPSPISERLQPTNVAEFRVNNQGNETSNLEPKPATHIDDDMESEPTPLIEEECVDNVENGDGAIIPPLQLQHLLEDDDVETEEDEESPVTGEIPPLALAAREAILSKHSPGDATSPRTQTRTNNTSNPENTKSAPKSKPIVKELSLSPSNNTQRPSTNTVHQRWSVDSLLERRVRLLENGNQNQSEQKRKSNVSLPNKRIMPRLVNQKPLDSMNRKQQKRQNANKEKTTNPIAAGKVEKKEAPRMKQKRRISFRDQLDLEPPVAKRAGRRAARFAKAAIASAANAVTPIKNTSHSSNTTTIDESGWNEQQVNAYEAQRDKVPLDSQNYWVLVAQGVPGKSSEECRARWLDTNRTPDKATARASTSNGAKNKKPSKAESTPEIAAAYAANGVSKAHARTARFASNMRRIVAASAREAAATAAPAFVPSPVAGYSPATPLRMDGLESDGTPGTEARVRRREMEQFALPQTPEPFANDKENGVQAADRVVAQFRKRFGNLLTGSAPATHSPLVETNRNQSNVQHPTMEEALAARAQARSEAYDDDLLT